MEKRQLTRRFRLEKEPIRKAASDILTQSEMMTRAACPRKWFYRYALKLDRKGAVNYHLIYGSCMHAALAKLYSSGEYGHTYKEYFIEVPPVELPEDTILAPGDREEIELIRKKVQIAFNAYRMHYYKVDAEMRVRKVEQVFSTKWNGLTLQGRIDMVAHPNIHDGAFIWDFKTAGRFDAAMLDAWSFRFQFLFYCWLYWKCTGERPAGTIVNGLGKSQLRPSIVDRKTKRKESPEEFLKRVRGDMQANREKYFYRQRMPLTSRALEQFEREILKPHADSFLLLGNSGCLDITMNSLAMAMNTGHCHIYNSFCEFLPLCKDGPLMLAEYQQREVKHNELEVEIGEE